MGKHCHSLPLDDCTNLAWFDLAPDPPERIPTCLENDAELSAHDMSSALAIYRHFRVMSPRRPPQSCKRRGSRKKFTLLYCKGLTEAATSRRKVRPGNCLLSTDQLRCPEFNHLNSQLKRKQFHDF